MQRDRILREFQEGVIQDEFASGKANLEAGGGQDIPTQRSCQTLAHHRTLNGLDGKFGRNNRQLATEHGEAQSDIAAICNQKDSTFEPIQATSSVQEDQHQQRCPEQYPLVELQKTFVDR